MTDSTFERSCEHWSEAGRREMEDFYALAWVDYRYLAGALDWRSWLEARQRAVAGRPLRLLDVACGSGKFPAALVRDAGVAGAELEPVEYALLDPSAFSIAEARAALAPPFVAGGEFETTLQGFDGTARAYDIVWATHALYAIPEAEIEAALVQFLAALGRDGVGFIAHACEDAHYLRFHRDYLEDFRRGAGLAPYTSAEQLVSVLERLGAPVRTRDITYHNGTGIEERDRVEGYLQRCVFDDDVTLDALESAPNTGAWLATCRDAQRWAFPQRVKLIFINDHTEGSAP
jgi:SAM-dependent methyltransferase